MLCLTVVVGTPAVADGGVQGLHPGPAEQEGHPDRLW